MLCLVPGMIMFLLESNTSPLQNYQLNPYRVVLVFKIAATEDLHKQCST